MKFNRYIFALLMSVTVSSAYALNTLCSRGDQVAINGAIKRFMAKNSAIAYSDVSIAAKKCAQDYARATLHPLKPVTDNATVYLQKQNGQWQVLQLGTSFDSAFLGKIPAELK